MTFFLARQRIVRAKQWFAPGDHEAVHAGVRVGSGTLDITQAEPFARRHVEPGDWIVFSGNHKAHVLTPAEFSQQFEEA